MTEKANYLKEKVQQKEYRGKQENKEFLLAEVHANEIRSELKENNNIKTCCDKECPHYLPIKNNPTPTSPNSNPPKNNSISKTDLKNYMEQHHISKISLENNQLKIEY